LHQSELTKLNMRIFFILIYINPLKDLLCILHAWTKCSLTFSLTKLFFINIYFIQKIIYINDNLKMYFGPFFLFLDYYFVFKFYFYLNLLNLWKILIFQFFNFNSMLDCHFFKSQNFVNFCLFIIYFNYFSIQYNFRIDIQVKNLN